jgi:hypothetical protein
VLRSYRYLAKLEGEIRGRLAEDWAITSFSRESESYWRDRPKLLGSVKFVYVGLLGVLLVVFLVGKFVNDISNQDWWLAVVDLLIGAPTLVYFAAYARSAVELDVEPD